MKESAKPATSKTADAASKPMLPWIVAGGAVAALLVVVGVVALYLVFRTPRPASDDEKTVMKNLEKEYEAVCKLDDKGRVTHVELEKRFVTDDAIDEVVKLKYLKHLSLRDSSVTDEGIAKLPQLKRLEALGITETNVTDQGLMYLERMPALRYIWVVTNDRLTQRGVDSLKRALPGATIYVMNAKN